MYNVNQFNQKKNEIINSANSKLEKIWKSINFSIETQIENLLKYLQRPPFKEIEIIWMDIVPHRYILRLKGYKEKFITEKRHANIGDIIYVTERALNGAFNTNEYVGHCFMVSGLCDNPDYVDGVYIGTGKHPWKIFDTQYLVLRSLSDKTDKKNK